MGKLRLEEGSEALILSTNNQRTLVRTCMELLPSHARAQGFRKTAVVPFMTLIWIQVPTVWPRAGYLGSLSLWPW